MNKNKDEQPLKDAEVEAASQAEADNEARVEDPQVGQLEDEEQLDAGAEQKITNTETETPAELAAVHTDNISAQEASGAQASKKAPAKVKPKKVRSQKYLQSAAKVNPVKSYVIAEALKLVKESSYSKFDPTIEIHVRLTPKKGEKTDSIRGLIQLPHGSVKKPNVKLLSEDLIEEIARTKKVEADILIATPALMPKVAKIAKILGPIGKMPSPKAGTVSDKPEDVIKSIESGRVEYRADNQAIVHLAIGKGSWDDTNLKENALAVIGALPKNQLLSVSMSATMGPGIKVDLNSLL